MPDAERPRVTVSDPRAPGQVVVQGEEPGPAIRPPRVPRTGGRRWPLLVLGVVLGFGASQLLEAQRDRRESDRLGAVLDLRLTGTPEGVQLVEERLRPTVSVVLGIENRGPLPVVLGDITVEGSDLVGPEPGDQSLDPGVDGALLLTQAVTCPQDAPPRTPAAGSRVVLRARTQAGPQEVRVELPEPARTVLAEVLARACGRVLDEEALEVVPESALVRDGELLLSVRFVNRSARPLQIVSLTPGTGLAAQLRAGRGIPQSLPLSLPRSQFGTGAPDLVLVQGTVAVLAVGVPPDSCPGAGLLDRGPLAEVGYVVAAESGLSAGPVQTARLFDDLGVLPGLLRTVCP